MVFQDASGTPASADPKEYVPTVFDNLILEVGILETGTDASRVVVEK